MILVKRNSSAVVNRFTESFIVPSTSNTARYFSNEPLPEKSIVPSKNIDYLIDQYLNIQRIESFLELLPDWNGYGAEQLRENVADRAIDMLKSPDLLHQPRVFLTGRNSIQFEYETEDRSHYLEAEIYERHLTILEMNGTKVEYKSSNGTWKNFISRANKFDFRQQETTTAK